MKLDQESKRVRLFVSRLGLAAGLLFATALLLAAPASAGFEQVDNFADIGEGIQFEGSTGMAVNTTGAGGVPVGTIYATTGSHYSVVRYSPDGEFREAWGWGVATIEPEFQRCGPDGEAVYPMCRSGVYFGALGEGVGQLAQPEGIAVDQTTGNVYVVNSAGPSRQHNVIQVFSADGSELITSFGDAGVLGETFDEGPEKLHFMDASGIVVDESGVIYLKDLKNTSPEEKRVMIFKPQSPGDYKHYVYTGRANDIDGVSGRLALDNAGNLYNATSEDIFERDLASPAAPICKFHLAAGGIQGMTVNPETGEPFYFSYKTKKVQQLSACNSKGEFTPVSSFAVTPKTEGIYGMAFNPLLSFSPDRQPGILYTADGETHPGKTPSENILGIGEIFAPAVARLPSVESESVSSVTSSTATLNAQINPKGSQTSYVFQYLSEAEYEANEPADRFVGAIEVPLGGAQLGSGQVGLSASAAAVGLSPDTTYRFRAIATSHCDPDDETKVCEGVGTDASFHTFAAEAPGLPDERAYELVSPTLKNGGEVYPLNPEVATCGIECKPGASAQAFPRQSTPDGEAVVYEGQPFSLSEGANVYNEYLSKRTPSGWQTTVLAPKLMGSNLQGYKAFNAELTKGVLYQQDPSLTPSAPSEYANLYTQSSADPPLLQALVGTTPPNRTPGHTGGNSFGLAYAGASADFSKQFFAANDALTGATSFAPEAVEPGATKKNLYEAVGGELHLVNVLPGNAETAPGHFGAVFLKVVNHNESTSDLSHAISEDGSRVFWSDEAGQVYVRIDGETTLEIPDSAKYLTASADGSRVMLRDGHIYDLETEAITDLTEGQGGFQGITGQSEDLSHVYFVDTAVLTGEAENDHGAKAQAGGFNLYAWDEGVVTYVATLVQADNELTFGGDWHFTPAERTAEASPGGRWVAFLSKAPLTGYGNFGPCGDAGATGACSEAFLYDSETGTLSCPSCNPSGEKPLGSSSLVLTKPTVEAEDPLSQTRYLNDQGRLYFDSRDSLIPFDTNNGIEDVYQYEPEGVGTCKREGGCVNLISAGREPVDSNFLAVDEIGENVFFTTRDQLVLKDKDDLYDLYVAREHGGIASETETGRGECQGEACQGVISPPNDPTPGSASFEGAGNVDEKKAAKKHKKKSKKHAKKHAHKRAAKHNRGGAR